MIYKLVLGIVIFYQCFSSNSLNSKNIDEFLASCIIDTIYLDRPIHFESNVKDILKKCISYDYDYKSFSKRDAESMKKVFNTELNTTEFDRIKIMTGTKLKFENSSSWIKIVEWHFDSIESTNIIEEKISQLERGIIRHTLYPNQFISSRKNKKIYIINFRPVLGEEFWVEEFHTCINLD